jgi:hypothetical protein
MDNIRVNKITVNVDKTYDEVNISLYKTNELLGTLTGEDLGIPPFEGCGVSLKAYQAYCRDFVIELLDKDGIPGYYYEPKSEHQSVKYGNLAFKQSVVEYVDTLLKDRYEYKVLDTERIEVAEKYKDSYIKNASGEFDIKLTQYNIIITVLSEIKSGQLCRPKIMKFNDQEYSFNITNVGRIIKLV